MSFKVMEVFGGVGSVARFGPGPPVV